MQSSSNKWLCTALSAIALTALAQSPSIAKDPAVIGKGSTSDKLDIVNELKRRGSFHKTLDGLSIAYNMDNQLKGRGPFTFFAPDDKAWGKMPGEDQTSLFNNPKRVSEVLSYHVLKDQRINSDAIAMQRTLQPMDLKHKINVSSKTEDNKKELYVDKARIKEADIQCSNGVIHIIDQPIMPRLAE